jgi:trans-aconitate 2-methyltransferase
MAWDDAQYLKFADERTRPAAELLARVPLATAGRVTDLGCGPGNSTALLRARFPGATLVGVDSSGEMLARARRELPDATFVHGDVGGYVAEVPQDLLFANAVLHWLPAHERLVPALFGQLRPGGVLAFQVPCNFDEPSHRLMRELSGPWASRVAHVRSAPAVGTPAFYYDLLASRAASIDIWQTTYQHVMADARAIVEWVKGTGLRPYLDEVGSADRDAYLTAYESAIEAAYEPRADGRRLFRFPRLFVVAVR